MCLAGGERVLRHNALRDLVYSWAERACLRPEKERAGLLLPQRPDDVSSARRRPADVYLHGTSAVGRSWSQGSHYGCCGLCWPQTPTSRHCGCMRSPASRLFADGGWDHRGLGPRGCQGIGAHCSLRCCRHYGRPRCCDLAAAGLRPGASLAGQGGLAPQGWADQLDLSCSWGKKLGGFCFGSERPLLVSAHSFSSWPG